VATSRDLTSAAGLLAFLIAVVAFAPAGVARFLDFFSRSLRAATRPPDFGASLAAAAATLKDQLAPPVLAAVGAVVAAGLFQTRGLFALEPLRLDVGRLVPSWRRLSSAAALVEVAKGVLKVLVVAALGWLTLRGFVRPLAALTGAGAATILRALGRMAGALAVRLSVAALALGLLDWLWQRQRHQKALRMTRAELRREQKEGEGDRRHKSERQRLHRALSEQQMLAEIRKADFVVVNPEHLAVAVRYDRAGAGAPVVVAKGERLLAERIKEVAREAGVPVFRDVSLARSLATLDEGQEVPEALYEAVAEILRVVYGMDSPEARRV
jgi:flagellar biosynthesis protein FlhB